MKFEILINDTIENLVADSGIENCSKIHLLSMINDFEDGEWRFGKFQNTIWNNVGLTALSFKEREALIGEPMSVMKAAAKNLRIIDDDAFGSGSEIAEILLYAVMEHYCNALSVVPKIFYKQNAADNAKGADSVHIVVEGDDFSIWFGESKFFNSIEDPRLYEIINSVIESLGTAKLKKENSIITNVSDLNDLDISDELKEKIFKALSPSESIDEIKPKIHIPILLLNECPITQNQKTISPEYKAELIEYHKNRASSYFTKLLKKLRAVHLFEEITFHLIIVPVFKKEPIISAFNETAKFLKR
jgi:hypothetical protein|tara:strand:+ start:136 stop:1044 length:909 start_codon:yes stop_codon:yes gene_type:complete